MKTLLVTLTLLSLSFIVSRADRPLELDSGTYTFSWTDGANEETFPVRLTATIEARLSYLDRADIVIEPDGDNLLFNPGGKFVGYSSVVYADGKMTSGDIALSMTTINPQSMAIRTVHLKGTISNHSAKGEGSYFIDRNKRGDLKWTLTKVQD